jgi:hypothetical protein
MRANIYIDGFNLYYGALKGTPYKWLDLEALSRKLVPNHDIHRIRYFTARIAPKPDDPAARRRQYVYLRGLETNPRVTIHLGRFQQTTARMALVVPRSGWPRTVEVIKTEEKGTDVNIATYLLLDAFRSDSDVSLVISNDADLAEPIRVLMKEFPVNVGIANPCQQPSAELRRLGPTFFKQIKARALRDSQLPGTLKDSVGVIRRPDKW